MNKKFKILLIISSLIFVSFSCSCLFGKVTNTANNTIASDEVINTKTADSAPTAAATATGTTATAVPTEAVKEVKQEITPAATSAVTPVKKKTPKAAAVNEAKATPVPDKVSELVEKIRKGQADVAASKTKISMKTFAGGGAPQFIKGEAIIKKKDKFRVHYTEPSEQDIISDGKTIWIYTPALSQVMKQSVKGSNNGTQFYSDFSSSISHYVKNSDTVLGEDETSYTLTMSPRDKNAIGYDEIIIKVTKKDLVPFYMSMKTQGTITEIEFLDTVNYKESEIAGNKELAESNFKFTVPEGVEVIDAAELEGAIK